MTDLIASLLLFAPPAGGEAPNPFVQLVPLVLIFVVFYFFLIRPQQKKQKEREKVLESLKRGDRITTIGGMHGTVAGIDSEKKTVLVQVADNVKITFDRSAVANIDKQESGEKLSTKD
ncbi:preprotein translocase subunit YajC [Prosthecochloris sp. N3]|uniref:Sec translocon accessory complex subunit YajC n=1 Tax=Prosthecochloris ethylica TaxID=2743976 RepID=A0ABR9XP80_9CHLB|nr:MULTISPECIES: preprotein translocase subunit YajC [Prosthecochloris]MEC9486406.1 preprotein translocase subunit YajC [Prosthecochloris sp.]MBF0585894.1 preprotein translocase subunit YajC [Prosthecochloris ethylica]MBF0635804.1 preprotein translocase subunit YajC [Prosthecochloris ethylica]NUK47102.1 preprotein translocase subunit YajC [Prosthecochloris ethylica]RNA65580.1 preprotein translocase subunit YajC [Prosthecochloris sp. ZM_2]